MLPKKLRICMSRLRLSSHRLKIETGRYAQNRIERNLRYCTLCNSNNIEYEFHSVIICTCYNLIKPYYYNRPSMAKFIEHMQSKKYGVVLNMCKYIQQAFNVRNTLKIQTT